MDLEKMKRSGDEFDAWQDVCASLRYHNIDPNDTEYQDLINALTTWAEKLSLLREIAPLPKG